MGHSGRLGCCRLFTFAFAYLFLFAITSRADDTGLPNLSTITDTTVSTTSIDSTSITSATTSSDVSTSASTSTTRLDESQTSSSTTSSYVGLTGAPTLAGASIPSLIVPDTSDAPFMQKSNLPEGTVFICVGAALGFLGACVLAWRGLVAWSLQRSVQRAASAHYVSETKSAYRPGPFGGHGNTYDDKNMSLEQLTSINTAYQGGGQPINQRSNRTGRSKGITKTPTTSSLFFSPTAGAGASLAPGNRVSGYLPAGYYASGSAAAAAGAAVTHIGGPPAAGYGRVESAEPSPPGTPGVRPSPGRRLSSESNQNSYSARDQRRSRTGNKFGQELPGQRTPSAMLDSWFDHSTAMGRSDRG